MSTALMPSSARTTLGATLPSCAAALAPCSGLPPASALLEPEPSPFSSRGEELSVPGETAASGSLCMPAIQAVMQRNGGACKCDL